MPCRVKACTNEATPPFSYFLPARDQSMHSKADQNKPESRGSSRITELSWNFLLVDGNCLEEASLLEVLQKMS